MIKKKAIMLMLIGLLLAVSAPLSVWAGGQAEEPDYPSKAVEVVVPWAAGGGTDTVARAVLSVMNEFFPEPMVVVNKPGGGSVVGFTEAMQAEPDGYTIVITGIGTTVTQPLMQDVQYAPDDYEVVCQLSGFPRILAARNDAPYDNLPELMDYARGNPGGVEVGIAAPGTSGHFGMLEMEHNFDVDFTMNPQGGGGPQRTALIGGHVDVAPLTASEGGPPVRDGQVKPLAIMAADPLSELPDIPTTYDEGYPVTSGVWWHVYVPAGTPQERIDMLDEAFRNALQHDAVQTMDQRLALGIQYKPGPEAYDEIREMYETYAEVAEELDL